MATSFLDLCSPRIRIACVILFVCNSLLFFPFCESIYFEITSFDAFATNIIYSGDAVASSRVIEFNRVSSAGRIGHAKYANAVHIWDRKSGKLSDFTTHFTFVIDTLGKSSYGHGLAFFLAPVDFEIPPNSRGSYLGMFNSSNAESSQNQMIAIEFDSYSNENWDPTFEHVGINKNTIRSVNYTAWNVSFHSGEPANASVSYNATTQMLSVSWRYPTENASRENTSLTYRVDLREVLPEWITIGFSAGIGGGREERHILQYWKFNSSLNIVERSDQDISKKRKLAVGFIVPVCVFIVGGIVIIFATIFRRRRRQPTRKLLDMPPMTSTNDDLERGVGPKRFSYSDLILATNNFSDDEKLGEGGFGCVYKGYLSCEGIPVAVKKISQGSKQGKKEFITEVKIISSLRHRNLVQLIGWCHDRQTQFVLVYEFMPNGSLDSHLFGNKNPLQWVVRYKIVMGLASALFYLHEECEQCVVHRDIKTSNIMLDSGFNVKLGDFGLALLMDHETCLKTTGLAGTLGYMAPEYIKTRKASKESDVYSFGVVALEIVCGRKTTDVVDPEYALGLVHWVYSLLEKGELLSGVDPLLKKEFEVKEAECLMMVGLWCAHPKRSLRPSIKQAIQMLKFECAVPNLEKEMPMPMYNTEPDAPVCSGAIMTNNSIELER